jgi:hypothetical protein
MCECVGKIVAFDKVQHASIFAGRAKHGEYRYPGLERRLRKKTYPVAIKRRVEVGMQRDVDRSKRGRAVQSPACDQRHGTDIAKMCFQFSQRTLGFLAGLAGKRSKPRTYLAKTVDDPREERLEDYLVRFLIERNEIDYDTHADLLYKLAGQVVARISSYLETPADIENVLLRNGRQFAEFIFAQMMQNYEETQLGDDDFDVRVTRGFMLLQPQPFNVVPGQKVRDFRQAVSPMSDTKRQVFGGFKKCCYSLQKFDSDPERRFAVPVDADPAVEKWLKPGRAQFQIEYRSGDNYGVRTIISVAHELFR